MVTTPADDTAVDPAVSDSVTPDSTAPDSTAPDSTAPGPDPGTPDLLRYVAIALVVIAAACAGWFGWSWHQSAHSASLAAARARDQALQQGQQAVQNFNTLDYRHLSRGLELWEQSSTGTLLKEITAGRTQFEQEISKAKTVTTASILDAAITSLNERAGTADIIVALQITVTPPTGSPTTKQSRLEGALTKTASGWKLSALGQVPVGNAAPTSTPSSSP